MRPTFVSIFHCREGFIIKNQNITIKNLLSINITSNHNRKMKRLYNTLYIYVYRLYMALGTLH